MQLAVCHDLSCWLHGCDERIAELRARYGDDVEVELDEVSCLGRCDIAPAVAVDERPAPLADAEGWSPPRATASRLPRARARTGVARTTLRSPASERYGVFARCSPAS